jgi:hypothetical protein
MSRLRPGTYLVEVDRPGRWGLAPRGAAELRAVDLESGLEIFLSSRMEARDPTPVISAGGELITISSAAGSTSIERLTISAGARTRSLPLPGGDAPVIRLCLAEDDRHLVLLRGDGRLQLVDLFREEVRFTRQLSDGPGGLLSVRADQGLIAVARSCELTLLSFDGEQIGRRPMEQADWICLGSVWLASISTLGMLELLEVIPGRDPAGWEVVLSFELPESVQLPKSQGRRGCRLVEAALDDLGRLAVRLGTGRIGLFRLPGLASREVAVCARHEAILTTLLRFVWSPTRLLSSDTAGRVITWPRSAWP